MVPLHIVLDGDDILAGQQDKLKKPCTVMEADELTITSLVAGMTSGKPSVTLILGFPDGSVRLVQTSLRLFLTAADAFKARHGDPREPDWKPPTLGDA